MTTPFHRLLLLLLVLTGGLVGIVPASQVEAPREARGRPAPAHPNRAPGEAGPYRYHRVPGNLVQNSSFEQDWYNRAFAEQRRFLLLQASDMGVGEADGLVDHWRAQNVDVERAWDTGTARSGSRSLRLQGSGRVMQMVRFAGEQNWRRGGSQYAEWMPMERSLAAQVARRPIAVGAWCRTADVPPGREPRLEVSLVCGARPSVDSRQMREQGKEQQSVSYSPGTHDWQYREIRIDPGRLPGTVFTLTVTLIPPASGTAWFDDLSCVEEPLPTQANRLPNPGFEKPDETGMPEGWSAPVHWDWWRNDYYLFTGWSHSGRRDRRGGAASDPLVTFTGGRSLKFDVYPGDNFAVRSAPIWLEQERPRPIEARAMVKADGLRGLEIMAQDERGEWLPQGDFLGDDMENNPGTYNMGTTGSGTYDWYCVRKYFSPRKPVKSVRLFLCARGFDGKIVEKNRVGTVWFDDLQLFEHGGPAAGAEAPPPSPSFFPFQVADVELGDRLWGTNEFRVVLSLPDAEAARAAGSGSLELRLTDPAGAVVSSAGRVEVLQPPRDGAPGCAVASAPYRVETLCRSWTEQYRLQARLTAGGKTMELTLPFGTPSRLMTAGVSGYYGYPGETLSVFASVNVSRDSFPELTRCEILARSGNSERKLAEITDFGALLRPQTAPRYLDTSRLVQAVVRSEGQKVHPWHEPVRDTLATVRLYGRADTGEKLLAELPTETFGFMEAVPKPRMPETIRKTAVNERGFLTVNDQVYFPVFWTPHFGILKEADYPPRVLGFKSVDLTPLVLGGEAPDAEMKQKLLAKIAEVRGDPKLFQYELGEGEMQLQGPGWTGRVQRLKQAIAWIREADPHHLINGPESWLVGHPRHNTAMQAFIPDWDVIGVEASFEEVPQIGRFALPLMKGRKTAVLVGLETYYYQSPEVLRWRGYRAVLEGAAGIGLCPSGMLQARPDRENFLRGLNGEFRGLAPIITALEPKERIRCSSPGVLTMERVLEGKRYLIAVGPGEGSGALKPRFTLPAGTPLTRVRAMFEGRALPLKNGGFEDEFPAPHTVRVYELTR